LSQVANYPGIPWVFFENGLELCENIKALGAFLLIFSLKPQKLSKKISWQLFEFFEQFA